MKSMPQRAEVLVVGLGPVGAVIANLLGQYGVQTLVVDQAPQVLTHPRAIALDNEALRILQMAGVRDGDFEIVGIQKVMMRSPYVGTFAHINTGGCWDGHAKLATFFQPELERVLRTKLDRFGHVSVALGCEVVALIEEGAAVRATLRGPAGALHSVEARYVIGADGANSFVRRSIGLDFTGQTYAEDWLIVDAKGMRDPIDHVEFLCNPRRPTPHMVAPGGRVRWEFKLRPGERRETIEHPDSVRALLAPWGRPEDMQIERTAVYRFHARVAECFQRGHIFLAGDSAHITPPFAGQGLVSGLRDAANLCWKLAWVLKGQASETILLSYDQERRPHANAMIGLAKFLGSLVMPRNVPRAILTHGLIRVLRVVPALRSLLEDLKIKPAHQFAEGLFATSSRSRRTALVRGGQFPQVLLQNAEGETCWSDEALGHHLALVGFGVDPGALVNDALGPWQAAGGRCVQICHRSQRLHVGARGKAWEDITGALVPAVAPFGWVAIVRPDRTILHDGPAHEAPRLVREALALLAAPTAQASVPVPATARKIATGGRIMTSFTPRADAPIIKASDIAYVRFARRDLALAERYFGDFGLQVCARTDKAIYLRGLLARPHCVIVERATHDGFAGLGLCAATAADLRTLAEVLGATVEASAEPGGGEVVRLRDPAGLPVEVVHGIEPLPELPHRQPRVANLPGRKLRVNAPQPAVAGPAEVFRLGHAVLQRQEFVRNANWYVQTFGLIASDVEVLPGSREPLIAFMRCDRGSEPADHHTVVIAFGPEDAFDHAAFETLDLDSVGLGAEWLQRNGWVKSWGVGRHVLGSQIFCYHYDPSGFAVEHYADGDVFDASCATRFHEADVGGIYAWGPDLPKHFIDTGMSLRRLAKVLRGLRSRSEFTLSRLLAAKRTYSSKPRPWAGQAFHKPKPT